ncbi:MAG: excinuclease ABC subunit UvrC [Candidatus Omnitrophota bacterium]|nr:excinuclease ABC subunit UvrC [Candidatus Omnitrophota bacterium]
MLKNKVKQFPQTPGVYIMKSKKDQTLYIGKAASLKKRVLSYFLSSRTHKTDVFMSKVEDIEYIECQSEAQALILEASLIKERKPQYNIALRDDKSYPYVEITKDEFPRIFVSRPKGKTDSILLGPYPKVKLLKAALDMVRKVFPYCSCRGRFRKSCLFYHIGLCPGPCAKKVSAREYRKNIRSIYRILKGEREKLIRELEKNMKKLSEQKKFEEAARERDKLVVLNTLYHGKGSVNQLLSLKEILGLSSLPRVIEAMDISSLSGKQATGAVVVFRDGEPDKNSYRRYRIKEVEKIDDYAMIGEVFRRRYKSFIEENRKLPDLIIVDGGKGHVQRVRQEMAALGEASALIGIAKRNEEIWFPDKKSPLIIPKDNPCLHLLQRIRDQAHRFAQSYHKLLRKKGLINRP